MLYHRQFYKIFFRHVINVNHKLATWNGVKVTLKSYARHNRSPLKTIVLTVYSIYGYFILSRLASMALSRRAKECKGVLGAVRLAFNFRCSDPLANTLGVKCVVDIKPAQIFEEILELARIVAELKPKLQISWAGIGIIYV